MAELKARNVFVLQTQASAEYCLWTVVTVRLGALVLLSSTIEIVHGFSLKPKVIAGRVRSIYKMYEWLRKGRWGGGGGGGGGDRTLIARSYIIFSHMAYC